MLWALLCPHSPKCLQSLQTLVCCLSLSCPVASSLWSMCCRRGTRYDRAGSQQRLTTLNQDLGTAGTLGRAVPPSWSPVMPSTPSLQRSVHSWPGSGDVRGTAWTCLALRILTSWLVSLKDEGTCVFNLPTNRMQSCLSTTPWTVCFPPKPIPQAPINQSQQPHFSTGPNGVGGV